jgi:hypothetical protein
VGGRPRFIPNARHPLAGRGPSFITSPCGRGWRELVVPAKAGTQWPVFPEPAEGPGAVSSPPASTLNLSSGRRACPGGTQNVGRVEACRARSGNTRARPVKPTNARHLCRHAAELRPTTFPPGHSARTVRFSPHLPHRQPVHFTYDVAPARIHRIDCGQLIVMNLNPRVEPSH